MASFSRSAEAVWKGSGKDGSGSLSAASGLLAGVPYSAGTRFGEGKGTNPEELIAAAHAGCFAMALAFGLGRAGKTPEQLDVKATVTIEQQGAGFAITSSKLVLKGRVPGMDAAEFKKAAEDAKANCPVSKVLNAEITLDASLA
jgi:osmotically inducible protein OsmC